MAAFHHIRLELAREPGYPHGDPRTGWDIVAALDKHGRLDLAACRANPIRCRVRRFIRDATVATGRLRKGKDAGWLFELKPDEALDDAGYRLKTDSFVLGATVTVVSPDGVSHIYGVERLQALVDDDPETAGPFD